MSVMSESFSERNNGTYCGETQPPIDQCRKAERFEVSIGKPYRKGLGPGEIPRTQTAASGITRQTADEPPVPTEPPGDGVVFSIAAIEPPVIAAEPNGSVRSVLTAFR